MSLFKTRSFWSTSCEDEEYFDQNSLITATLNSESDFIITSSQSNVLRIFKPSSELNEQQYLSDYKITDLLVEKLLGSPILQIGSGRLVSGSPKHQLAVLHPRTLSIYSLVIKEGATDHGTQHILQLLYEHKLRRSAANLVLGPFGGTQNRDFICVQSLDGLLTFFEQESFAFCCFLPEFLLPMPLSFSRKTDSFITCNSNWELTSYRYKLLSEAGQNSGEGDNAGRKFTSNWKCNLGESVIDIEAIDEPNLKENCIMVLGERNLFCIRSDGGKIKYMKKLDYSPICFTNYVLNDNFISVVVSETNNLLIYQNSSLKWSAQLQILPVAVKKATLQRIVGVLVLLSEEGRLECCYLGTDPSFFVAPPLINQELDYDKAGLELATLNKIIKNSYTNDIKVTNASAERELAINISISPHLETCTFESNIKNAINNQMCTISIDILPQAPFEEVQISVLVQRPLKITPPVEFFNNLSERTSIKYFAFMDETGQVPSLKVQVVASFVSTLGIPRSITKFAMLPLNLVAETCPPNKEAEHKVTLNINQSPVGLSTLFPEFAGQNSFSATSNAIGFKNATGEGSVASILLAKSSERYRLQSNSLASLNLLIEQTIYRLHKYFASNSEFKLICTSSLPISEILKYVNNHFSARQKFNALQNELSQLSAQFRLIQKRLISKFKVKNPTPLSNLELLLGDTFSEILKITENLEEAKEELVMAQTELSCVLHVVVNLVKLMDINNNVMMMVESTFSTSVYDLDGQNWEDVIDASLCYLLRTTLAKSEKDELRAAHTSFDEVKDITKLEKHLSQVLERILKSEMLETHFALSEDAEENTEISENDAKLRESVPIGSQIGASSSRALSARRGLLRKRHKLDDHQVVV